MDHVIRKATSKKPEPSAKKFLINIKPWALKCLFRYWEWGEASSYTSKQIKTML